MLVPIDYFTKWIEAVPLRNMTHREVVRFVEEHIIHRFRVPQTLMTDQLNSSPYYAQANGRPNLATRYSLSSSRRR
jgi:hypothetical protein